MTTLATPRIRIPRTAKPGEVIEIRTLIEHPMESGIRGGREGAVPRDMLTRLVVRRDGRPVAFLALSAQVVEAGLATWTGEGRGGSLIVRGRCEFEEVRNRTAIIVTEVPYLVNKAKMVERIAEVAELQPPA